MVDQKTAQSSPAFDTDVQKAQGLMRALGMEEVEVSGAKKPLNVDGRLGPVTQAALTKYRADNGLDDKQGLDSVLKHMEDRIQKNPPAIQQFVSETNADGAAAAPMNVRALQLVLNVLAPVIKALSGGKIDMETLKIDGINGPRTQNAMIAYDTQTNKQNAPQAEAKPQTPTPAEPAPPATQAQAPLPDPAKPAEAARGPATNANRPEPLAAAAATSAQAAVPQTTELSYKQTRSAAPLRDMPARAAQAGAGYEFNRVAGVEIRDRALQQRAELRAIGYPDGAIKNMIKDERMQELQAQGLDRRTAQSQASMESSMVDRVEQQMRRNQNVYERDMRREQSDYRRVVQQEDRHITDTSRRLGQAAGQMMDRNPRNDHQAKGAIAGVVVEGVLRGGIPGGAVGGARGGYGYDQRYEQRSGMVAGGGGSYSGGAGVSSRVLAAEDRDITRVSRDFSRAAGNLLDRNPRNDYQAKGSLIGMGVEAVLRGGIPGLSAGGGRGGYGQAPQSNPIAALSQAINGGSSRTYQAPPLPPGSYNGYQRVQGGEWNGNQMRPEFDGARSYAGMQDPRAGLSTANPQQTAPAQDTPQPDPAEQQRRTRDMYAPGG